MKVVTAVIISYFSVEQPTRSTTEARKHSKILR